MTTERVIGMLAPLRAGVGIAITLGAWAASAGVAEATFPGRNGLIAYSSDGNCDYDFRSPPGCSGIFIEVANPRQPNQRRVVACGADCRGTQPSWSPSGKFLLYDRDGDVFLSRTDGSLGRLMVEDATDPEWSPNGRRFVFTRDLRRPSARPDEDNLFVRSVRARRTHPLTSGGGERADWSVRGQIAFVRVDRRFRTDVFVVRPNGTEMRQLTRGGTSDHPSWSPDGRLLAIERKVGGRYNIVIIDRRGRLKRTLTRRGGLRPEWSPDGQRVAFMRGARTYTVRARGGGLRRIIPKSFPLDGLAWQPRPKRRN